MPNAEPVIYLESWRAAARSSAWWSLAITGATSLTAPASRHERLWLFVVAMLVFTAMNRLLSRVRITEQGALFQNRVARRALAPWPSAEAARILPRTDDTLVLVLAGGAIPVRLLLSEGIARLLPGDLVARLEAAVAEERASQRDMKPSSS